MSWTRHEIWSWAGPFQVLCFEAGGRLYTPAWVSHPVRCDLAWRQPPSAERGSRQEGPRWGALQVSASWRGGGRRSALCSGSPGPSETRGVSTSVILLGPALWPWWGAGAGVPKPSPPHPSPPHGAPQARGSAGRGLPRGAGLPRGGAGPGAESGPAEPAPLQRTCSTSCCRC